MEATEVFL